MCRALEKLVDEGWADGNLKGRREGELIGKIEGTVKTYQEFQATQKDAVLKLKREFGLTEEEAWDYVKKFWQV